MFKINYNKIFNEDCIVGLDKFNEEIDLTITSPPYNLGIKYDTYEDDLPIEEYEENMIKIFTKIYSKTKSDGRICVNVPPDIGILKQNNKTSLDYLFYKILLLSGFKYRTKIVWNKNQITSRTAWGSFQSPSNPNILPPFEYILVFYKDTPKKSGEKENIDIEKQEFIEWTNGMWTIAPESKKKVNHPSPYPEELCKRLIKMFSFVDDLILDPFVGSGTTCVAAKKLNRRYIGFDISNEYCLLSEERLKAI